MDIAVILPVYNGSRWLRQTLASVVSQSRPPREIVVVDDGSEDDSLAIARSFAGVTLLRNPGKGSHTSRNFGLQQTSAPLVAFLDQDDLWHSDHLQILGAILDRSPESPAAVASCLQFYSESRLKFPVPKTQADSFDPWKAFPTTSVAAPSAVLSRRSALEAIGGWPTWFTGVGCVDFYTWLRLAIDRPLRRNADATVGYRRHATSQGTQLRERDIQSLIATHSVMLGEALAYRLAVYPQEQERLEKRLALLPIFSEIIAAATVADSALLHKSALLYERHLEDESIAFLSSVNNLLLWFLYPRLMSSSSPLIFLLEKWPIEASRTRASFRLKVAVSRILPASFRNRPFHPALWSLLLESSEVILEKVVRKS
jgi:glycosyltransferase involved in cell wall biosynthesis